MRALAFKPVFSLLPEAGPRRVPRKLAGESDPSIRRPSIVVVVDGSFPGPKGAAVQVKDVHSAARKLPAQLNLKRMSHVVVNNEPERRVAGARPCGPCSGLET